MEAIKYEGKNINDIMQLDDVRMVMRYYNEWVVTLRDNTHIHTGDWLVKPDGDYQWRRATEKERQELERECKTE